MRAYNAPLDDYALFAQQEQANMASQGYTQALTNLGYVYLNSGTARRIDAALTSPIAANLC